MLDALVIGGGPAGLATSRELGARGISHQVLERGPGAAHTWENLYDSLRLHTGRHLSRLPGLRFPPRTPMFVDRQSFVEYLHRYADYFDVPLVTGCEVLRARRTDDGWSVETQRGEMRSRALVVATGIVSNPRVPRLSGRELFTGRVLHSAEYRAPDPFVARRVLIVGAGNSAGEIGAELARAGADVTVSVRSGANVVPLTLFGLPIQYASFLVRKLPRAAQEAVVAAVGKLTEIRRGPPVLPRPAHGPLDAIPMIGFHLIDLIRAGKVRVRPGITELTQRGARFTDGGEDAFDDIVLATGFRAATAMLGDTIRTDAAGFALRTDRVTSADLPDLYFVGHNYDSLGGLYNIAKDAPLAAERIERELRITNYELPQSTAAAGGRGHPHPRTPSPKTRPHPAAPRERGSS